MSKLKNQHYVPKVIIKRYFGDNTTSFYMLKNGKVIQKNINNVFMIKNIYNMGVTGDGDTVMENYFSKVESVYARIIDTDYDNPYSEYLFRMKLKHDLRFRNPYQILTMIALTNSYGDEIKKSINDFFENADGFHFPKKLGQQMAAITSSSQPIYYDLIKKDLRKMMPTITIIKFSRDMPLPQSMNIIVKPHAYSSATNEYFNKELVTWEFFPITSKKWILAEYDKENKPISGNYKNGMKNMRYKYKIHKATRNFESNMHMSLLRCEDTLSKNHFTVKDHQIQVKTISSRPEAHGKLYIIGDGSTMYIDSKLFQKEIALIKKEKPKSASLLKHYKKYEEDIKELTGLKPESSSDFTFELVDYTGNQ